MRRILQLLDRSGTSSHSTSGIETPTEIVSGLHAETLIMISTNLSEIRNRGTREI
jgi:hypothetical protein